MISITPLPHLYAYVSSLNEQLKADGHVPMTRLQSGMLCFVLLGMLVTQSLCWARLERGSGGAVRSGALSKWLYHGMKVWSHILRASTRVLMKRYGVVSGVLAIDDTDRGRSKNTTRIWGVHKTLLKGTGGFHKAQNIVVLLLVTPSISFPVGVRFYCPDPEMKLWKLNDEQLKEQGVPKKNRPKAPPANQDYPSREQLALDLIKEFQAEHPLVSIRAITADSAYCTPFLMTAIPSVYPKTQVLSQIRSNQKVRFRNGKNQSVSNFFKGRKWKTKTLKLRGHKDTIVHFCSAIVEVKSHERNFRVVALKYEDEEEPRFIISHDPSWQPEDIIRYYALRWLVEVFIEDWKQHEGWAQLAYQQDVDGARYGLILSLLLDHSLFFHAQQSDRIKHKLPALSVGSLRSAIQHESIFVTFQTVLQDEDPQKAFSALKERFQEICISNESTKHFSGRIMKKFSNEDYPGSQVKMAA
jgi:hypothetical protein